MRLKRIKLAGFKSFVDPTNIPFPGEMTAIVGPNGCGKSNVIDAVRWVLGESSAKNLRGDAMTDVIFNGSSARKPVGQCSVELVFDNTSNRIGGEYAKYNELSVKRVVTRDAQSFYYLNNTKCRRRDVTDIFLGTGLGPRSYAIIEQGMISRLIESKPQELRVFIEEAAGVSKYKERRKETLNRIKHTQENLERLSDVRTELGAQIDKLQRQAAAARRYTDLKQQQRTLQHDLLALKWVQQADKIEHTQQQINALTNELEAYKSKEQGDHTQLVQKQVQQQEAQAQLSELQEQKFKLLTQITRLEQDKKYQSERIRQTEQNIQQVQYQLDAQQQGFSGLTAQAQEAQAVLDELLPESLILKEQLHEYQRALHEAKSELSEFLRSSQNTANQYQDCKNQVAAKHSQIQALLSVQLKNQARQAELEQHTQALLLQMDTLTAQLAEQEQLCEEALLEHAEAQQKQQSSLQHLNTSQQQLKHSQEQFNIIERELRSAQVEHDTLCEFRTQQTAALPDAILNHCQLFSEYFKVASNAIAMIDGWLSTLPALMVVTIPRAEFIELLQAHDVLPLGYAFCFVEEFVSNKLLGLAQFVQADKVPDILFYTEAQEAVSGFGINNLLMFSADNSEAGALAREQKIQYLAQQIQSLATQKEALETQISVELERETSLKLEFDSAQNFERIAQQQAQQTAQTLQQLQLKTEHAKQTYLRHQESLQEVQESVEQEQMSLALLNEEIAELELQLEDFADVHERFGEQQSQLQEHVDELQSTVEQQQAVVHQAELNVQQAQSSAQYLQQTLASHKEQISEKQLQLEELNESLLLLNEPSEYESGELQTQLAQQAEIEEQILVVQQQMAIFDEEIKVLEQGATGYRAQLQLLNDKVQSAKLELEGHNVRAAGFVEQLAQHNANLKDLIPSLDRDADVTAMEDELGQIGQKIQRLGAVNLAAVDEYEVQAERKAHLDEQFTDLSSALETLETAMRKIDHETKTRFKSTFEQVNNDLKMLFPKVFGGGAAYLELTGDDMLDTGVTIMARPPGKKNSTIHLLSGGEKALTALSLVFAIFRLNPAPFCLLDEVDAPLDDANVGRFCKLVSEMSKTVQFIYISHNKIAMEMATHLTGVTMAEPGVSRMVSVDLAEAVAIVEA